MSLLNLSLIPIIVVVLVGVILCEFKSHPSPLCMAPWSNG